MAQPSFPLFKPARDDWPEDPEFGVFDVLRNEARRAAFEGSGEGDNVRFSLDIPDWCERHLQAMATALGMSRRALGAKLLKGAILEAMNTLSREGQRKDPDPEFYAVWSEYEAALEQQQKDAA